MASSNYTTADLEVLSSKKQEDQEKRKNIEEILGELAIPLDDLTSDDDKDKSAAKKLITSAINQYIAHKSEDDKISEDCPDDIDIDDFLYWRGLRRRSTTQYGGWTENVEGHEELKLVKDVNGTVKEDGRLIGFSKFGTLRLTVETSEFNIIFKNNNIENIDAVINKLTDLKDDIEYTMKLNKAANKDNGSSTVQAKAGAIHAPKFGKKTNNKPASSVPVPVNTEDDTPKPAPSIKKQHPKKQ